MKKKLFLGFLVSALSCLTLPTFASDSEKQSHDSQRPGELHETMRKAFSESRSSDEDDMKLRELQKSLRGADEIDEQLESRYKRITEHLKKVLESDELKEAQAHCQGDCEEEDQKENDSRVSVTVGAVRVELDNQVSFIESKKLFEAIETHLEKHWHGRHHQYLADATKAGYYLKVVKSYQEVDDLAEDRSVEVYLDVDANTTALLGLLRLSARVALAEIDALPDGEKQFVQDELERSFLHILPFLGVNPPNKATIKPKSAKGFFSFILTMFQLSELDKELSADDDQPGSLSLLQEVIQASHDAGLDDDVAIFKGYSDLLSFSPCSLASVYSLRRDTLLPHFGKPLTGWCDSLVGLKVH